MLLRFVEAFNRRDLDALAELCHPEFELVSVLTAVDADGATYRGERGYADYWADMDEAWKVWRVEEVRVFDAGGDRVAAVYLLVGEGKHSGVSVQRKVGITGRILEGKLWRMRSYLDPSEALEALGLRE